MMTMHFSSFFVIFGANHIKNYHKKNKIKSDIELININD